jgi:hypothetical protein
VRQNVADIHFVPVEMNGRDQPIFVAANIEHTPFADFVGCKRIFRAA